MENKRKSRFPMVLLVLIIIIGMSFTFAVNKMKDRYRELDVKSNEVASMIPEIKDYRKIKGFKVIKDTGEYKILLISAGLTYGKDDKISIKEVSFDSDKVKVVVEEMLEIDPKEEAVRYPFVILKVDTTKDEIEVVNTNGDVYSEINLHDPTAGIPESQTTVDKEDEKVEEESKEEDEEAKEEDEKVEEESKEEDKEEDEEIKEESKDIIYVKGEYQGRIDGSSIEVKVGSEYITFDISGMSLSFKNYDYGTKLNIGYIEENGSNVLISVSE